MIKKIAYDDILKCMNKDYVRHLGRYLDKVKYKLYGNIKEVIQCVICIQWWWAITHC